jgi:hypothetical protein
MEKLKGTLKKGRFEFRALVKRISRNKEFLLIN